MLCSRVRYCMILQFEFLDTERKNSMNRKELVVAVAERSGLTQKNADAILKAFCEEICEQLSKGEEVGLTGYMKFTQAHRKARTAHNPRTGEPLQVPATTVVKIQAGSKLKAAVKASSSK